MDLLFMWSTLIVISSLPILLYWYFTRNFDYWSKRGINGPKPIPIFGNLWELMITRPRIFTELEWYKKYGKIYGYFNHVGPTLTIADPELIKQILVKDFHILPNRQQRKNPHPVMSKSLVDVNGDDWKRVRSITTPTFTSGKMKRMYPLMKQCFEDFAEHLRPLADQKTNIDLKAQFSNFTLDVISTCAFATKFNVHKDTENNMFVKNAISSFNFNMTKQLAQLVFPKTIVKLLYITGLFKTVSADFFINSLRQILNDRRKSDKKYNDLFQLLIEAEKDDQNMRHENDINESHHVNEGADELEAEKRALNIKLDNKQLTENEMLAQSVVVLLAGYETTATTLSFCTYELALNQDIQQKLYEEVKTIIDSKGQISYDELSRLPYLDACLMETLRLHSPAQRIARTTIDDYKLGNTGITLYKGQQIDVPIYAIHHSEEYYAKPFEFNPERFMPENRHNIIPYTYLPFGAGPRNCIGMRFALLEAKLGLAHIIQKYRFFPTDKTDVPLKYKKSILTAAERVVMYLIYLSIILIVILALLYSYLTRNFDYWSKQGINGPKPWPIVGNIVQLCVIGSRLDTEINWLKKYGKIYGIFDQNGPKLTVAEPELIKQILVKDFHIFPDRMSIEYPHPVIGKNLFFINGSVWKRIRSITTPVFTSAKTKRMYPLINKCCQNLDKQLGSLADQKLNVDLKEQYYRFTMDLITNCAFATKFKDYKETENNLFNDRVLKLSHFIETTYLIHLFSPKLLIKMLSIFGVFNSESTDYIINYLRHIFNNRRKLNKKYYDLIQLFIEAEKVDENVETNDINKCVDQELLQPQVENLSLDNRKLTENEIIALCLTVLVAGFETSATTLSFCSYELAVNEDCQQKLYKEIMSTIDSNDEICYNDLLRLPYLDACITETLRLHSPIIRYDRQAIKDYKLGDTGITVYKGQIVDIPIYAIHLSEEFYADPHQFNPERFLPENKNKIIPYTYLPFGAGPRNCIGMQFALIAIKLCLAKIIQKYRFYPTDKTDIPIKYKKSIVTAAENVIVGIEHRN
ncbi:uncharacterized protein LOC128959051 [Oppia nitens]|uniref:uncharacterized protein LOC128959051 n=1 Tax=Oppia nitens TaxID=1686743 RepID=UPI0023DCBCE6|nr:uncharacterized protein LOC128959051 [Oppia nitens]